MSFWSVINVLIAKVFINIFGGYVGWELKVGVSEKDEKLFCEKIEKIYFLKTAKTGGQTLMSIIQRFGVRHNSSFLIGANEIGKFMKNKNHKTFKVLKLLHQAKRLLSFRINERLGCSIRTGARLLDWKDEKGKVRHSNKPYEI